jgi:hypothetical protein
MHTHVSHPMPAPATAAFGTATIGYLTGAGIPRRASGWTPMAPTLLVSSCRPGSLAPAKGRHSPPCMPAKADHPPRPPTPTHTHTPGSRTGAWWFLNTPQGGGPSSLHATAACCASGTHRSARSCCSAPPVAPSPAARRLSRSLHQLPPPRSCQAQWALHATGRVLWASIGVPGSFQPSSWGPRGAQPKPPLQG